MKVDDMSVEDMEDLLGELYSEKFGGGLEELKSPNPGGDAYARMIRKDVETAKRGLESATRGLEELRGAIETEGRRPMPSEEDRIAGYEESIEYYRSEIERLESKLRESKGGLNPGLDRCTIMGITEDKDIEIRFSDASECWDVEEEYRDILKTALGGGETIYKTLK